MATYIIKDAEGNIVNRISASLDFVETYYEYYEEDNSALAVEAKEWRNSELDRTDLLMTVSDYPYKEALVVYRAALRDWPSTEDFPLVRPVQGV